jgi:hypothetical protein
LGWYRTRLQVQCQCAVFPNGCSFNCRYHKIFILVEALVVQQSRSLYPGTLVWENLSLFKCLSISLAKMRFCLLLWILFGANYRQSNPRLVESKLEKEEENVIERQLAMLQLSSL